MVFSVLECEGKEKSLPRSIPKLQLIEWTVFFEIKPIEFVLGSKQKVRLLQRSMFLTSFLSNAKTHFERSSLVLFWRTFISQNKLPLVKFTVGSVWATCTFQCWKSTFLPFQEVSKIVIFNVSLKLQKKRWDLEEEKIDINKWKISIVTDYWVGRNDTGIGSVSCEEYDTWNYKLLYVFLFLFHAFLSIDSFPSIFISYYFISFMFAQPLQKKNALLFFFHYFFLFSSFLIFFLDLFSKLQFYLIIFFNFQMDINSIIHLRIHHLDLTLLIFFTSLFFH